MKRLIAAAMSVGMMFITAVPMAAADAAVSVQLDGETVSFSGQQPVIIDNRTLIPLRGVFEKMGYTISWEPNTKTATLTADGTTVSVSANSDTFIVNGEVKPLDVPAQIMNGSMMLPLRAIGESAGANVTWNGAAKVVEIDTESLGTEDIVQASEYFSLYSQAIASLDSVEALCNEFKSLEGEVTVEQLQSYKSRLNDALQTINSVKAAVNELSVPDSMAELHSVRLEAIDKFSELVNVLIDYCDGKINNEELTEKINTISSEVTEITKENNRIFEELEGELLG